MNGLLLVLSTLASSVLGKKIYIDNDGLEPLQLLFPIAAGHEVVGLSTSFGSASVVDGAGEAYDVLKTYNLSSCIPQYVGAQQPLLRTANTFAIWQELFGELIWQGAFDPDYKNTYSWSNITYNDSISGANALINAVKENKDTDPVIVFAAGMMTTVAQAISIYPDLPKEAGALYIMGGYIDTQYDEAIGDSTEIDINTDINLMQDPEAAQIVLTADWNKIVIGGNVTNYLVPSQELYNRIIARGGSMSKLEGNPYFAPVVEILGTGNYSLNNDQQTLPFWDEVVSALMSWDDLIESSINVSCAVDTSFYSPFYGNLRIWNPEYAPKKGYQLANATLINSIDDAQFYDLFIDTLFTNWTQYCHTGKDTPLIY